MELEHMTGNSYAMPTPKLAVAVLFLGTIGNTDAL
jgi:hypothetical protein